MEIKDAEIQLKIKRIKHGCQELLSLADFLKTEIQEILKLLGDEEDARRNKRD
jgi:hypothetical protein